jgi:probable F420-dependent oxidoreductase
VIRLTSANASPSCSTCSDVRYGITLPASGVALGGLPDWVRLCADLGFTDLWIGESTQADAVALLGMAAVVAPGLYLGTAVLPAATRTPGLLALSTATLAGLAPGRLSIGLGASSAGVVRNWGGGTYERPVERTRDVVRFLRRALRGEKITETYGTFAVQGFALPEPPATPPPLLVAGLQPGMLRLAAREADGAVLTLVAPEDIARVREVVGPDLPLVVWATACAYLDPADAGRARALARRMLGGYLRIPAYAAAAAWHGRSGAVTDELIDALVIHGTPEACRQRVAEFTGAGVDLVLLSPLPLDGDAMAATRLLSP